MWTRTGSVLTVSSRALITACARLGLDTDALLASVGLERATLDDPDGRLEPGMVSALWARAYALSGDPVLSLHAAEACPMGAYKVIDYIAANAPTVGDAFLYGARYFPLINTAIRMPIDDRGEPVTFDVEDETGPMGVTRPYAEYCFAAFVLHIRHATGVPFPVESITFVHPEPSDTSEHERVYGCPVRFNAPHNRLCMSRAAWTTPARGPDPGVLRVLMEHADHLLTRLPQAPDLVERTRRAIADSLRGGDASLEAVARVMCLSTRSLQRHLGELGYSYNDLASQVREAHARLYLAQPDIAVSEVAYLLGFSDVSTFHRAFKRWTGETPARYRAQLLSGAARES